MSDVNILNTLSNVCFLNVENNLKFTQFRELHFLTMNLLSKQLAGLDYQSLLPAVCPSRSFRLDLAEHCRSAPRLLILAPHLPSALIDSFCGFDNKPLSNTPCKALSSNGA